MNPKSLHKGRPRATAPGAPGDGAPGAISRQEIAVALSRVSAGLLEQAGSATTAERAGMALRMAAELGFSAAGGDGPAGAAAPADDPVGGPLAERLASAERALIVRRIFARLDAEARRRPATAAGPAPDSPAPTGEE